MSADSESKFIPSSYQGDFWGGYKADYFLYKAFAISPLGFFGADQLILRSPFTAFLKFIVNVLFYGAWYFYDIIQVLTDEEFIANYGMSTPWGPKGLGYRFFKDVTPNNINELPNPSSDYAGISGTIAFILYNLFCLYVPFGFDAWAAGDYVGGLMKILSLIFIFTIPYYMITGFFNYFRSGTVEKEGVPRSWPVQGLMRFLLHDDAEFYPAVNMISKEEGDKKLEEYKNGVKAFRDQQTTKTPGVTAWEAFYGWATAPVRLMGASARGLESGADAAKAGVKITELTAKGMEQSLAKGDGLPIHAIPDAPAAHALSGTQTGGGLYNQAAQDLDMIVLGGVVLLIVGGFAISFVRKITTPKRTEENEYPRKSYERNDAPPEPGGL